MNTLTVEEAPKLPRLSRGPRQRDIITAVDIGTTKIVALVGKKDLNGRIQILGRGTVLTPENIVKRGVVLNIDQAAKKIQEAIEQAQEQSGIKFNDVFVGIAGHHIQCRRESHSKVLRTEDKEITQALLEEMRNELTGLSLPPGQKIIQIIPQYYRVNNETTEINPCGMYGNKIMGIYNVITGEIDSITNILRCFERIEINVDDIYLEPLASAEAVLTEEEREAGVALVDIGGGTTDIAVYYDKVLRHTAVIPLGGNIVTDDIRKGCNILRRHAEALKVQFGSTVSDTASENKVVSIPGINGREQKEIPLKVLAKIIQARMNEIIEIIALEIKNSGVQQNLGAGIVITGGGAMIKELPQLINYEVGQEAKLAYPGTHLSSDHKKVNSPVFSTAVGLLMLGAQKQENMIFDDVPPEDTTLEEKEENPENNPNNNNNPRRQSNFISGIDRIMGFFDTIRDTVDKTFRENDTEFDES